MPLLLAWSTGFRRFGQVPGLILSATDMSYEPSFFDETVLEIQSDGSAMRKR